MTEFPPITHVALTVRDLSVSVPWYEALLDAKPVLDEDTDPDFHHTVYLIGGNMLFGLHEHGKGAPDEGSASSRSASTTLPLAEPIKGRSRIGRADSTASAWNTVRSRMLCVARA
jgi:catechol 2,3-dioxygenase-like lactoylglutathione lyase family enzyme